MSWLSVNLAGTLLLPPLNLIILGVIGVCLLGRYPKAGRGLLVVTIGLLYVLATPFVAENLLKSLEVLPARLVVDDKTQAIVVLGGGTYVNAMEFGGHTTGRFTLERIRYAAYLHRLTGKPLLLTGGDPMDIGMAEAVQMKTVLESEFGAPVRWVEDASDNTRENAIRSFAILGKEGVTDILLVTHAWHMPRAAAEFRHAGFHVTPAPTAFTTRFRTDALTFVPTTSALEKSRLFMHEIIGMMWYWLTRT
jgi:uncharacterized SAM-binding protein YcdF (DUF218 family)